MKSRWRITKVIAALIGAAARVGGLDNEGGEMNYLAEMDRVFPLRSEAVSWESINWKNYSKIIVSGPQRSGTTVRGVLLHVPY